MKREWIKLVIAEPYPVVCHADMPGCELKPENHKCGGNHPGPFYAAGSEWFYTPEDRFLVSSIEDSLKRQGYTVTVASVTR